MNWVCEAKWGFSRQSRQGRAFRQSQQPIKAAEALNFRKYHYIRELFLRVRAHSKLIIIVILEIMVATFVYFLYCFLHPR